MKKNIENKYETLMFNKEYYEIFSLEILKRKFPTRYANLIHIGGNKSPDLQSQDKIVGVEVTRAFVQNKVKANAYFAKFGGAKASEVPSKVYEDLYKFGYKFSFCNELTDMLFDNDIRSDEEKIIEQCNTTINSVKHKIDKLNKSHYREFKEQDLFVFLGSYLEMNLIEKICNEIFEYQKSFIKNFNNIYFYATKNYGHYLFHCIDKNTILVYEISDFEQICRKNAYTLSGMEEKSLQLLKQQGHI